MQISILGIPSDEHSSFERGCRLAPAAIREAFRCASSNTFAENELDVGSHPVVRDAGDVPWSCDEEAFDEVEKTVAGLLSRRHRIVSLGGDHSVTYPILHAYAACQGPVNVLQLDAHPDLYDQLDGDRFSHACPFARLHEEKLIDHHTQIGIRTMNSHQRQQADRFGVNVIPASQWRPEQQLKIPGPLYLTLDLDVLDPAFAPGISHYEPGGLSVRDVLTIIQQVEGSLVGADIVELNPTRDIQNMTAMVAAKFLKELLAVMIGQGQ